MTKREARAILAFQRRINTACDAVEGALTGNELASAQSYWLAHIRASANGTCYGSAPIVRAEEIAEGRLG